MRPATSVAWWRGMVMLAWIVAGGLAAAPAFAQQLYWLDTNFAAPALHRANADGSQPTAIALFSGSLPEALALDPATGRLYWCEARFAGARIMSAPVTLATTTPVLSGLSSLRGLAVRPGASLFWTSSNLASGSAIDSLPLAGGPAHAILGLGAGANPRALVLDTAAGKFYYADFDQGAIMGANLDGSGAAVVVSTGAGSGPYGLVFDSATRRLYWTEFATGRLRRFDLIARAPVTVFSGLANPTYVALDPAGQRLYWIDSGVGGQRIRSGSTGGGTITDLALPISTYGGIVFAPLGTVDAPSVAPTLDAGLRPIRPNPVAGAATIEYVLPRDARARVTVLDVQGRVVATLANGVESAGPHHVLWSAAGASARPPAGLYFVALETPGRRWVQRMILTH